MYDDSSTNNVRSVYGMSQNSAKNNSGDDELAAEEDLGDLDTIIIEDAEEAEAKVEVL